MKPRTQAELDALYAQHPGLEESIKAAAYVDYHVQAERNKFTTNWQYNDHMTHGDSSSDDHVHRQTFPQAEYTIWKRSRR